MPEQAEQPPLVLEEGPPRAYQFKVYAGQLSDVRIALDGMERVNWTITVENNYDMILNTYVSCDVGNGQSRVFEVTERERSSEFDGYLDLSGPHAASFQEIVGDASPGHARAGPAHLILLFDNTYSWYTAKTVVLWLAKVGGAPRDASAYHGPFAECVASGDWERALNLLERMTDSSITPDIACYDKAIAVCTIHKRWEETLQILTKMRAAGVPIGHQCFTSAITVCEAAGQPEAALKLMDEMQALGVEESAAPAGDQGQGIDWIKWALSESLARCPLDADDLQGHLEASLSSLGRYARRKGITTPEL